MLIAALFLTLLLPATAFIFWGVTSSIQQVAPREWLRFGSGASQPQGLLGLSIFVFSGRFLRYRNFRLTGFCFAAWLYVGFWLVAFFGGLLVAVPPMMEAAATFAAEH